MPKNPSIKKVLVIGSGPIIIGQAAEFDYAGTQACRSLKEEGIEVVLLNSNPATIMTDKDIADRVYIEPLTVEVVEQLILKEQPDSVLPTLGGQAGLNLAMELEEAGFLKEHNVRLIGTTAQTIKKAEDRLEFKETMEKIGEPVAPSKVVETVEDGIIVDLTDKLLDLSPNYQYLIDSNPEIAPIFRNDGKVLCYQSPYENFVENQGLVIRQDWLDEQGLALPTTYDQMFETLKTFRDAYSTSTAIYFNSDCNINGLTVGYDVAVFSAGGTATSLPYYAVDGVVHCSLIEDGYRDYLKEMNKWYNEGLFNKDFGSIAYDPMGGELAELQANGTVGVWCTSGEGIGNITQDVSCVPNLVQNEGDMDHQTSTSLVTDSTNTYVTSCCEDVETAMKFLDYLYSEDGILFYNYGFEGIDYTLDENNTPRFTDAVINNEYGVDVTNMLRIRRPYTLCSSLMILYATAEFNTDLKNEAWEVWSSNIDGAYYIPSNVSMNAEETQTSSYYVADIVTYASQMIPQFIAGDVSLDEWDAFVAKLKEMNIETCIEAEQSAYDRCMA